MHLLSRIRSLLSVVPQWRRIHRSAGTGIRHRDLHDVVSQIQPKRILLLRLDGLGDFLLSLRAFRHFRRCFPEAALEILVGPGNLELAGLTGLFDAVHSYPFFEQDQAGNRLNDKQLRNALADLKLGSFDIVVDMRHYGSTRRLAAAIDGRLRAGFRAPRKDEAFGLLMPDFDSLPKGRRAHASDRQMSLAAAVAEAFDKQPAPKRCDDFLAARGWRKKAGGSGETVICINPFSGRPIKDWPITSFAAVAELLVRRPSTRICVLGDSPGATPGGRDMLTSLGGAVDLGAQLPVDSLIDRLAEADLYIGNDSGTTHLAAQLGVPTIAIMSGDVDIEVWRPIGPRTIVLRSDVACAPCNLNTLPRCPVGHVCMTTIMPATVLEAADELLSTGGQDAVRPSRA